MKGHRFDVVSFVFGLVFLVAAVVFSIPGLELDIYAVRWGAAALLVVVGAGLVVGSMTRGRQDDRETSDG